MGWGGGGDVKRSFEVEQAIDATLSMGWGGVGMLTFGWIWTRHWCYAEDGVGWGCERSFEVEHATDATLSMGWGGDVNVRLKLNTPLMLRWAWGGVGMWTFVWSWTRHWCYAEHGVGWGGDVNVRLNLNTPLMLRWAWGGVGMWTFVWSSTCTMITETGKAKKGPDFVWKGCQTQEKWPFFFKRFLLWDGYETLKGFSFFDNDDAPTRAIPHPAGYIYIYSSIDSSYPLYIYMYKYEYNGQYIHILSTIAFIEL